MINYKSSSLIRFSEMYPEVHGRIYEVYAKPVGLKKDDYILYTDQNLSLGGSPVDIVWQGGTVIHICSRIHPADNPLLFKDILKHIFANPKIRELLWIDPKLRKLQPGTINLISSTYLGRDSIQAKKKRAIHKFTTRIFTRVSVRDQHTGREQSIEVINGNAFEAHEEAQRLLYGDSSV